MRESPFWVTEPALCVEPTDDGWIVVRDAPVGRLVVRLDEAEPLAEDRLRRSCDSRHVTTRVTFV